MTHLRIAAARRTMIVYGLAAADEEGFSIWKIWRALVRARGRPPPPSWPRADEASLLHFRVGV